MHPVDISRDTHLSWVCSHCVTNMTLAATDEKGLKKKILTNKKMMMERGNRNEKFRNWRTGDQREKIVAATETAAAAAKKEDL